MTVKHVQHIGLLIAALAIVLCGCSSTRQGHGGVAVTPTATSHDFSSASSTRSAPHPESGAPPIGIRTKTITHSVSPPRSLTDIVDSMKPLDPEPYMGAHPNVYFISPSRNIGCYIFIEGADSAQCTIARYEFDQPGPDCPHGAIVQVDSAGTPSFVSCAQYSLYTEGNRILPYGYSLTNGQFTCASAETGISCMDRYTGTGFTLNRASFTQYT